MVQSKLLLIFFVTYCLSAHPAKGSAESGKNGTTISKEPERSLSHLLIGDKSIPSSRRNKGHFVASNASNAYRKTHDVAATTDPGRELTIGKHFPDTPTLPTDVPNGPHAMYEEGPLPFGVAVDEHYMLGMSTNRRQPACGRNERFTECSRCEVTCTEDPNKPCPIICGPSKCECPASLGFARNKEGQCVDVTECEKEIECPENEEWIFCAGCEPSCDNPQVRCEDYCEEARCECRTGMLRNRHGKCVRSAECLSE